MGKEPEINDTINRLRAIQNNSIGVITLAEDLDIDSVTEIFIRINSKGVVLSRAEFAAKPEFDAIKWAATKNAPIYRTCHTDILRVAFTYKFKRGKLADLVSLLSGRDFETREFKIEIEEKSFHQLHEAVLQAVNQTNYERYLMIVRSAGIVKKIIDSFTECFEFWLCTFPCTS